jgi:ribosomal protein S18 acetylase RimI-like enzyme
MTQLSLAGPDHIDAVTRLVADFHREDGITQDDAARRAALMPLLEGSPHGAVYLAGLLRAPVGYIVVSFGWSVEFGGLIGVIDEFYIRPSVRGRGLGTEILATLPKALGRAGIHALHLDVARDKPKVQRMYERAGFVAREGDVMMVRLL